MIRLLPSGDPVITSSEVFEIQAGLLTKAGFFVTRNIIVVQ
jgi:hypothetical protein